MKQVVIKYTTCCFMSSFGFLRDKEMLWDQIACVLASFFDLFLGQLLGILMGLDGSLYLDRFL